MGGVLLIRLFSGRSYFRGTTVIPFRTDCMESLAARVGMHDEHHTKRNRQAAFQDCRVRSTSDFLGGLVKR